MYNAYRAYKMLYYVILDAICFLLFLHHIGVSDIEQERSANQLCHNVRPRKDRLYWFCERKHFKKVFFRQNRWYISELTQYCLQSRTSRKLLDINTVGWKIQVPPLWEILCTRSIFESTWRENPWYLQKTQDQLHDYLLMLFKLVILHNNLDTSVYMGDGERAVRSAKYALPI